MPLNVSTPSHWFQTSVPPALAAGDLHLPTTTINIFLCTSMPATTSFGSILAPWVRVGTERVTLSMKCTLPCWRWRWQPLPHTDSCFSAFPVKQLVGLNHSNDVSTSRALPSLVSLATVSYRHLLSLLPPVRNALILNSLGSWHSAECPCCAQQRGFWNDLNVKARTTELTEASDQPKSIEVNIWENRKKKLRHSPYHQQLGRKMCAAFVAQQQGIALGTGTQ